MDLAAAEGTDIGQLSAQRYCSGADSQRHNSCRLSDVLNLLGEPDPACMTTFSEKVSNDSCAAQSANSSDLRDVCVHSDNNLNWQQAWATWKL